MNHRAWVMGCWVLALALASACKEHVVYHAYRAVPIDGWEQTDLLTFGLDTVQAGGTYQISVGLRTTNAYPYQSLWLLIETQEYPSEALELDTLVCRLSDGRGHRRGSGIDTYQYRYPLTTKFLNQGQSLTFRVCHIMRREMLPGVSDVGIEVERVEPKDRP